MIINIYSFLVKHPNEEEQNLTANCNPLVIDLDAKSQDIDTQSNDSGFSHKISESELSESMELTPDNISNYEDTTNKKDVTAISNTKISSNFKRILCKCGAPNCKKYLI